MATVIGVQFEGSPKIYTYFTGGLEVDINHIVAVPTSRGWGWGIARVAKVDYPEGFEKDLLYKLKPIRTVLGEL